MEKKLLHLKKRDYKILKRLVYTCIHKGKADIFGAFTGKNELCAGAFFIKSNKKAIFLFSAVNKEARKNGAMSLLINKYIKENSQSNLTLDFEGSNNPNLARFYKSFGSKECYYPFIKINLLPWYIKHTVYFMKYFKNIILQNI